MATLEEFMRTGQLGAVILGASPSDVMTALGDPDDISKKTNPLILKYRCVQLTFWKAPKERTPQLREIVLAFQPFEPPPEFLEITDWNPQEPPSERDFRAFIERVDYPPAHVVEGQSEKAFLFPSGVSALVSEGKLHSIRLQEKENKATPPAPVTDEREATMDQIHGMLIEAEYVVAAGAARSALLIGWAALEATLRRLALQAGRQGKVGVQPLILLRELFASGHLTPEDRRTLELLRQQRTAAAHGLATVDLSTDSARMLIDFTEKLLDRVELGSERDAVVRP